eukprot:gene7078-2390_t
MFTCLVWQSKLRWSEPATLKKFKTLTADAIAAQQGGIWELFAHALVVLRSRLQEARDKKYAAERARQRITTLRATAAAARSELAVLATGL